MNNDGSLYKKIGRKYVMVSDDDSLFTYLRDGFYLIHAYDCGRSLTRVSPDNIRVKAAAKLMSDAMVKAMQEKARPVPLSREMTPKEKRGYSAYMKVVGYGSPMRWQGASLHEVVEAGIEVLEKGMA